MVKHKTTTVRNVNDNITKYNKKIAKLQTLELKLRLNPTQSYQIKQIQQKIKILSKTIQTKQQQKQKIEISNKRKMAEQNRKYIMDNVQSVLTDVKSYNTQSKNYKQLLEGNFTNNTLINNNEDLCPSCNTKYKYIPTTSKLICTDCGNECDFLDATSSRMTYGNSVEFTNYQYEKQAHFRKWMHSTQSRGKKPVPPEHIEKIILELHNSGYGYAQITILVIKKMLKKLKLSKHYQSTSQIWATITGHNPPTLTPQEENQLECMFQKVQEVWDIVRPVNRSNFLSYPYVLYKFCQLIGRIDLLKFIILHKGSDKIKQEERIFEKICDQVKWTFIRI